MIPVFMVARRLESDDVEMVTEMPVRASDARHGSNTLWISAAFTLLVTAVGPAWARIVEPATAASERLSASLPENVAGWRGPLQTAWDWQPLFVGATNEKIGEYRRKDKVVLSYANVYATQKQGKELIFHSNSIIGGWRHRVVVGAKSTVSVGLAGPFRREMAASPYGSWIILHRYIIGGEPVLGEFRGKISQSLASLQGRSEAGVIAYAIPCSTSCRESMRDLAEFVSAVSENETVRIAKEDR